ncbi:MAG TPA: GNAT family N-acetyltransferase [Solirubrobacteraceae bacterium]|nr:GNAT family N-acetyltransferase [Solirubrobacteraceae bacterium]
MAERTEQLPWGTAVFHAGMPLVRETNVVRVEAHAPDLPADEVIAAVEARFADRPYRNVEVLDADTGAALAPALKAAGFATSRHLLMGLDADPPPAPAPVEEVAPDEVWPLREEWLRTEPTATDELAAALLVWERERARVTRARAFCVRDTHGRPASMCLLMATPHATEVELVYTTPGERRRGLAFATVARAAAEADGDCTFLFTDAAGPAQHLYARLGFHRAGLVHRFVRAPR